MSEKKPAPKISGRFAYEGLQRLMHEKARLSILASLAANTDGLLFAELKSLCSLTDGNLSRQIQLLQESGLVEVWKGSVGRAVRTLCRLTESGRRQFLEYIAVLQSVVVDAHSTAQSKSDHPKRLMPRAAPAI